MDTATRFLWRPARLKEDGQDMEAWDRPGYSATLLGHLIWVVGGSGQISRVSVLDVEAPSWIHRHIEFSDAEFLRFHNATLLDDKILLRGVMLKSQLDIANEVCALDVVTKELSVLTTYNRKEMPSYRANSTVQVDEPSSTMAFVSAERSRPTDNHFKGKLYTLNLITMTWSAPETMGGGPGTRHGRALQSCLGGSKMFVYSALDEAGRGASIGYFDLAAKRMYAWTELTILGERISRYRPFFSYVGKGRLLCYGGSVGREKTTNSFTIIEGANSSTPTAYHMDVTTRRKKYFAGGMPPSPNVAPRVVLRQDKLVVLKSNDSSGAVMHFLYPILSKAKRNAI